MKTKGRAFAVIGAGYGDEGKGLMTDYLAASTAADVVVRTNGGAQAGHTVTAPDGRRHVFSHVGSGAFAGTPTHLSRHFVVHPMFFNDEAEEVRALRGSVSLTADPRAAVTTPFDIMVNQIVEDHRGNARHGSCGMGFGETVERSLDADMSLTVADLHVGGARLAARLGAIRRLWVPERLRRLGVERIPDRFRPLLADDAISLHFIDDCERFAAGVAMRGDATLSGTVVFEGAQGLMLDQDYGHFPHVTRSNTGVTNMASVALEAGIGEIAAHYMTRAYTTRHGAGPLAHDGTPTGYADIVDPTNMPNDWQGSIRLAPLDVDVLAAAVRHDLSRVPAGVRVTASLALTCADQLRDAATVFAGGAERTVKAASLPRFLAGNSGIPVSHVSYGPTRATMEDARPAPALAA